MKVINNFISDSEKLNLINIISELDYKQNINNKHIKEVADNLKGTSFLFDLTNNDISIELSNFQSSGNIQPNVDIIFYKLMDRISKTLNISQDNVFLQVLNQDTGGLIHPHYDSAIDGYITYKCNICIQSDEYQLFVDKDILKIKELDLYCFEASLYKHWTNPFKNKRIILSYGFILTYKDLDRDEKDPRVRLSKRIVKYFQKKG
jgi:hypothetical protein